MFNFRNFFSALFILLSFGAAQAQNANPVPTVPKDDPAMRAAYARARAGLDGFLTAMVQPPKGAEHFAVKIGLADDPAGKGAVIVRPGQKSVGFAEYFWISGAQPSPNGFDGRIDNEPDTIRGVRAGQTIHFVKDDIADWMYVQDGKIKGNATACPALAHATAAERKQIAEDYGIVCD